MAGSKTQLQVGLGLISQPIIFLVSILITIERDRLRANAGDDVSIFCRIDGFPIRKIQWIHNGRLILARNSSENIEIESGSQREEARKKRGELELEL